MPEIQIPKSGHIAFRKLIDLTAKEFDTLVEAVKQTPPAASPDLFWRRVAEKLSKIPRKTVESIIDELFSLNYARDNWGLSEEEFAKMASEAAFSQSPKKLPITEDEKKTLHLRLARLLELKASLSLTSKALDVITDAERVFYTARILTDIRPIFDDEGKKVEAAVIMHNLRIHYGQDNDHRDFFVALDTDDVKELRSVLDRADQKAESMQALLRGAKVSYLQMEE
jgi:hypothetical protein